MADRRVVISGIGPLTPIGTGIEAFWDGLRSERSAVRRLTRFDPTQFRSHLGGEVNDFDPTRWMEPRRAKRLDRCSQFTLSAARLALQDGGLDPAGEDPERFGARMGTALGGVAFAEREHEKYIAGGMTKTGG
jgi:3-oxoacyl-[acyl-carrier-protein] synthase II